MIHKEFKVPHQGNTAYELNYCIIDNTHGIVKYLVGSRKHRWQVRFCDETVNLTFIRGDHVHPAQELLYSKYVDECYRTNKYFVLFLGNTEKLRQMAMEHLFMEHVKHLKLVYDDTF